MLCGGSLVGAKLFLDINGQKDVKLVPATSTSATPINDYSPKDVKSLRALHADGSVEPQLGTKPNTCARLMKLPTGDHVLSIYADNATHPKVQLTHVITWGSVV